MELRVTELYMTCGKVQMFPTQTVLELDLK